MSQNDMNIANQTFPAFRSDLNSALQALASNSSGGSAPSTAYSGQLWVDTNTPSSNIWTVFQYDGLDWIPLYYLDALNNRRLGLGPFTPGRRLTLTSATPVTTSDVTAATTVYYSLYQHDRIPAYDGTNFYEVVTVELSLALSSNSGHTGYHQSGKNFDVFVTSVAGIAPLLGTGPAWSSDTSRGTGAGTTELQRLQGVWTNANTMTLRHGSASGNTVSVSANQATYVGTIRCTADGQVEDSEAKRFVWNAYNRTARSMRAADATDSWNYSTAAFRQMNNSAANQLDFVLGLPGDAVEARVQMSAVNSTSTARSIFAGIGLDSTTASSARLAAQGQATNTIAGNPMAAYTGYPGIGRHYLAALEYGGGSDTQTWYGDAGIPGQLQSGIVGTVFA